jgi:lipopolysaccharide transport system permease protein
MIKRELVGRYKGSALGFAWSFFNPVFTLAVYTFVFFRGLEIALGVGTDETKTQFAVVLFVGMIVHGLFAEVANRAPSPNSLQRQLRQESRLLSFGNTACRQHGTALFQTLISLGVLVAAVALSK